MAFLQKAPLLGTSGVACFLAAANEEKVSLGNGFIQVCVFIWVYIHTHICVLACIQMCAGGNNNGEFVYMVCGRH